MKSTKTARSTRSIRREAQNLEVCYGEIGILAVVAAIRYQGDARTPARASAGGQPDRWLNDTVSEFAA